MNNRLRALFADDKRWVNWKITSDGRKLPIDPRTGGLAKSNDPNTWGTYRRAKQRSDKIGIMLGSVDKYGGYYLCGIDLDGCLSGKTLRPEAREIVERFKKYTEISPSGKGVHIIFAVNKGDVEKIRETFGVEHRKTFAIGQHQEIALDLSNRYYTVTEDTYNDYDLIDSVKLGNLEWFLRDAGPAFQGTYAKNGKINLERDNSGSGFGLRFFMQCLGKGMSEEESMRAIKLRKDDAGDWAKRSGIRELQRTWTRATQYIASQHDEKNGFDYLTSELASEIELKPIRWMWPYYFAYGKLGMIVGDPNQGKSTVALDLAARVSRGLRWPDKSGRAPRGDVLILNAEDDKADTVVPRLVACGADLKRIRLLHMRSGKMFSLKDHLKQLEEHITKSTRMVIVDPVTAFMGAGVDIFRNNEVRSVLSPIVSLAELHGVLMLLVHHFRKNSRSDTPMGRISDSLAFGATCRQIYTCVPGRDGEHFFIKMRNSVAPETRGEGVGYSLENVDLGDKIRSSRVAWNDKKIDITLHEAFDLAHMAHENQKNGGKVHSGAVDFLRAELEAGPQPCAKIIEKAELRNISRRTLYRAADSLNINKISIAGVVTWSLATE